MKPTWLAIALLTTLFSSHSGKWVSTCTSKPSLCHEQIVALTKSEREVIAYQEARYKAASEALFKIETEQDETTEAIIKAHKMDTLPASHATHYGFIGGTCMGSIHFNNDGYIVYEPASDIQSCGEYK